MVMAIIGFILGSIQYQLRIRLQDVKENIYRIIPHYSDRGSRLTIYRALEIMRAHLKVEMDGTDRKEFEKCLNEWDYLHQSLHFWGVIFPLLCLVLYILYNIIIFFLNRGSI